MPLQGITPVYRVAAPSMWVYGVSAANTAQTVTIPAYTPTPGVATPNSAIAFNNLNAPAVGILLQTLINGIVVSCSADASGDIALTITDGVYTYEVDVSLTIGVPLNVPLPGAFIATIGNNVTVTLGAGASGSITKLNAAYQYV